MPSRNVHPGKTDSNIRVTRPDRLRRSLFAATSLHRNRTEDHCVSRALYLQLSDTIRQQYTTAVLLITARKHQRSSWIL